MGEEITGIVRLISDPSSIEALTKPKVQLLSGDNMVTNFGWWMKIKGFEHKKVKIIVAALP